MSDNYVHKEVFDAEIRNIKKDVMDLEKKMDRMIEGQNQSNRTSIWNLIMILATLVIQIIVMSRVLG